MPGTALGTEKYNRKQMNKRRIPALKTFLELHCPKC